MNSVDEDHLIDQQVRTANNILVSSNSCYREIPVVVVFNIGSYKIIECELWKTFANAVDYVKTVRGVVPTVQPLWLADQL